MRTPAIETTGLVKVFGDKRALDGVDLVVQQGTICGLLGPNGAGKTTMVRILATLLKLDGGSARVLGFDVASQPNRVRRHISLTGQFASVDEDLTGYENLMLISRLLGFRRADARSRTRELLETFDLTGAASRQVKTFSGGMKRKLDIAASLLVTPDLLFLDEPTTGLDPRSRVHVWDMVRGLVANGTTVLLTTQHLEEADQLADRITVVDRGRVIAEGTSSELKRSVGTGALHVRLADPEQREKARLILTLRLGQPVHMDSDPRTLTAKIADHDSAAAAIAALPEAGIPVSEFSLGQPSLDEVFFALTGHGTEIEHQKEDVA